MKQPSCDYCRRPAAYDILGFRCGRYRVCKVHWSPIRGRMRAAGADYRIRDVGSTVGKAPS